MELFNEIGLFLLAVITQWADFATGGVLMGAIWLWTNIRDTPFPRKAAIGLAIVFVGAAIFSAWRIEYEKSHPGLKLTIGSVGIGQAVVNDLTTVTLFAELRDTASPSIAENFYLEVILPDGRKTKSVPMMIHQARPVPFGLPGGNQAYFDPKDSLIYKVASNPIPLGGMSTGYVMFILPVSFTRDQVQAKGTKYILHCKDVDGNPVEGEMTSDGSFNGSMPFSPGITEPTYGAKQ